MNHNWSATKQRSNCGLRISGWIGRCTVPMEHNTLPDAPRIAGSSMRSLWHCEAASKKSVRHITRISCFVTTMKLSHALQSYSTVYGCIFKVMQQQNIGEVGNSITHLWADNFWLQQWKNYENRTVFAKVMLKWKRVQFFDSQCIHVCTSDVNITL